MGLAEAWRLRVAGQAAESAERLAVEGDLAQSLLGQGRHVEAERVLRTLHAVQMRVLGAEHPNTLATAADLARSLSNQGKYADAERIQREVLGALKRVLGAEIRTRWRMRTIWLCPSRAKANMPRLSRSSARCLGFKSACSVQRTQAR